MSELTTKQQLFVHEYLIDLNGTQAAIRAGYSKRSAEVQASKMLRKGKVKEVLDEALAQRIEETKIDANWVLERLASEAVADMGDLYDDNGNLLPIKQWPKLWRQGLVSGVETQKLGNGEDAISTVNKIKLIERSKIIDMIGKHVNVQAFANKLEHTGVNGTPLIPEEMHDMELARRVAFLLTTGSEYAEH